MKTNVGLLGYVSQRLTACFIGAALFSACAATTPPAGAQDPASAGAATAAEPSGSPSLAPAGEGEEPAAHDHSAHDHSAHQHGDGPATAHGDHAGHDHADHGAVAPARDAYTCPMHPEVRQNESGRCPKCGMNLEKAEADEKGE